MRLQVVLGQSQEVNSGRHDAFDVCEMTQTIFSEPAVQLTGKHVAWLYAITYSAASNRPTCCAQREGLPPRNPRWKNANDIQTLVPLLF